MENEMETVEIEGCKELNLSYYIAESIIFTLSLYYIYIYAHDGNLT